MSNDLSHVLITTGARLLAEDPRPDAERAARTRHSPRS